MHKYINVPLIIHEKNYIIHCSRNIYMYAACGSTSFNKIVRLPVKYVYQKYDYR